jgi:hypothetical protein
LEKSTKTSSHLIENLSNREGSEKRVLICWFFLVSEKLARRFQAWVVVGFWDFMAISLKLGTKIEDNIRG